MTAITGTDLSTGARFPFSQDDFDLLCSDLGKVRLSRAAATSSAVPVVLSPVTFHNYGGTCGAVLPAWVKDVTKPEGPERPAGRALLRYRDIQNFQDSKNRPYLHVVDGGVSDNLGVRGVLEALEELEASPAFQREVGFAAFAGSWWWWSTRARRRPPTGTAARARRASSRSCCSPRACRSTISPTSRSSC